MKALSIYLFIVGMTTTVFCSSWINRERAETDFNQIKPSSNAWGPVSEGIQISLQPNKEIVRRKEPVLIKVFLKNTTKMPITIAESTPEKDYNFSVTDDKGKSLPLTAYGENLSKNAEEYKRTLLVIKPGQVVEKTVAIDKLYDLSNSNTFYVSAKRAVFKLATKGMAQAISNTIKLQVID